MNLEVFFERATQAFEVLGVSSMVLGRAQPEPGASAGANEVRRLLTDQHTGGVGVPADDGRHDGRVGHPSSPSTPRTRSCGSTTLASSLPIRQVATGW